MKKEKIINIIKLLVTFTIFFYRSAIKYLLVILTTKDKKNISSTKDLILTITT